MSRSRTLNSFSWSLVILLVKDNKSIFKSNCSNCETNMKLGTVTDYGSNLKNSKRPYPKTARKSRNWWPYQKLWWRKSSSKPVILYTKWKLSACRSNFTKVIYAKNKLYFPSIYSLQLYKKMSSFTVPFKGFSDYSRTPIESTYEMATSDHINWRKYFLFSKSAENETKNLIRNE